MIPVMYILMYILMYITRIVHDMPHCRLPLRMVGYFLVLWWLVITTPVHYESGVGIATPPCRIHTVCVRHILQERRGVYTTGRGARA